MDLRLEISEKNNEVTLELVNISNPDVSVSLFCANYRHAKRLVEAIQVCENVKYTREID